MQRRKHSVCVRSWYLLQSVSDVYLSDAALSVTLPVVKSDGEAISGQRDSQAGLPSVYLVRIFRVYGYEYRASKTCSVLFVGKVHKSFIRHLVGLETHDVPPVAPHCKNVACFVT